MRSPVRIVSAVWRRHRLRGRIAHIAQQLTHGLGTAVRLQPAPGTGGGADLIFLVHESSASRIPGGQHPLAVVRIAGCARPRGPDEAGLPRIVLPADQRILREVQAYQRLSPAGLSPELLLHGEGFLANRWSPWIRAADILRKSEDAVWDLLPVCLNAIRDMHQAGVVHLDPNCGNLLVRPDRKAVMLIDFEYGPAPDQSLEMQQAFDYLRFAHNLLRPRRGLRAIRKDPDQFVRHFESVVGRRQWLIGNPPPEVMSRLNSIPPVRDGFRQMFGMTAP